MDSPGDYLEDVKDTNPNARTLKTSCPYNTFVQDEVKKLFPDMNFDAPANGDVIAVTQGTLGEIFYRHCATMCGERDFPKTESDVERVVFGWLRTLQVRYEDLELIDLLVIFAYSWRADRWMREEIVSLKGANFGKWQDFADQLVRSLRKLRRFTGMGLMRCSRKGPEHDGEQLLDGQEFLACSFLSTTYTAEALQGLESDNKYENGHTIVLQNSDPIEGYHIEEFSNFSGEHEVVLLPGHSLTYATHEGRNITVNVASEYEPAAVVDGDSQSPGEFKKLREERSAAIPPPPRGDTIQVASEQAGPPQAGPPQAGAPNPYRKPPRN